jgi:threonine dehydrogenase-like Zn-dependent dehydrogenase
MRANVWSGRNTVQVENVPDPTILNDRDAIVKITSTAICGSDLHLYDGYVPTMKRGDILGHEFMGEIVEKGRGVGNLEVGDRVVVPFPIACGNCWSCKHELYSACENSNPNAGIAEKMFGHACAGIFGYSHITGGYAGGQAEYARVPFADVGPIKIEEDLPDEQVLFLSDIFPTAYFGAELCDIKGGDTIAVFGAGPVGQLAIASALLLGAERVIAIDKYDYRLQMALNRAGATDIINFADDPDVVEQLKELTGGRGPDAIIDAVGMEATHGHAAMHAADRMKQATRSESDRGMALRDAIMACRPGGIVSVIGVYGGLMDKFPTGAFMNKALQLRTGQCPVQKYTRPLYERISAGEIDPSFIITHELGLEQAPDGFEAFKHKQDDCVKVVLKPGRERSNHANSAAH